MNAFGSSRTARLLLSAALVSLALVLQTSVLSFVAWHGVVPNLVLLVVVLGGMSRGAEFGVVLGFGAGLLLDLAPPADHVAGRWALALLLVGYLAGLTRRDARPTGGLILGTVAAASFLGSSVYAVGGLLLGDDGTGVAEMLRVVLTGVLYDLLVAVVVLPFVLRRRHRAELARVLA